MPINASGYNHFIIFRGVMGNRVLAADPAYGNRTMTIEKFEDLWIDYPDLGHVGFVVQAHGGSAPKGRLAPHAQEFLTLR